MRRTCWMALASTTACITLTGCLCSWLPAEAKDTAPQTPTGVTAVAGIRETVLAWDHTPKQRGGVRIERSTRESGPFCRVGVANASAGRFVDSGTLSDATMYYYRLVATAPCVRDSPPSAVVRTETAPPPAPPTELRADPTASGGVRLTWRESPSEGVLRYRVEGAKQDAPDEWTVFAHVSSEEFVADRCDELGKSGTVCRYRVAAVNRGGAESIPSPSVSFAFPR